MGAETTHIRVRDSDSDRIEAIRNKGETTAEAVERILSAFEEQRDNSQEPEETGEAAI